MASVKGSFAYLFLLGLVILFTGCGSHVYYEVKPKDTLYSISWRYNQDYREVAKWNDIEAPYLIKPGQWLRIAPPGPEVGLASNPIYKKPADRDAGNKHFARRDQSAAPTPVTSSPVVISKPITVTPSSPRPASSTSPPQLMMESRTSIKWRWPTDGVVIGTYKANNPGKKGVDIAGALGDIVTASAAGKVVYSGNGLRGYGNLIIIKHNDKYLSAYGHAQKILVKEGDFVNAGQAIARMGSTEADRVKLHFEIRVDGKPVNPVNYLPRRS